MTEQEALGVLDETAATGFMSMGEVRTALCLQALAVVTLANRIHMQQVKGALEELSGEHDRTMRQVAEVQHRVHELEVAVSQAVEGTVASLRRNLEVLDGRVFPPTQEGIPAPE